MKKLFILAITSLVTWNTLGQTTQSTNTVSNGNSYLGTSNNYDILFKRMGIEAGRLTTNSVSLGVGAKALNNSVSIGNDAGNFLNSSDANNVFIGFNSGKGMSLNTPNTGRYNTFIGSVTGSYNTTGDRNVFIGGNTGYSNRTGDDNVFIGVNTGGNNISGNYNTFIGNNAGSEYENNQNSIFIGHEAGGEAMTSNSILIGNRTGYFLNSNNKLIIDHYEISDPSAYSNTSPLIWGDFAEDKLKFHAKVAIGGNSTTAFGNYPTTVGSANIANYSLFVKGGILTEEVRVALANTWADYVFDKNYKLKTLPEVERFIQTNGHLPNVPSATQVAQEGVNVGEMAKIQQEKIEELTLYIIEQNKINERQAKEIETLKVKVQLLLDKK